MIRIERITQWLLRLFSRSVCTFTEWRMKTKWRFFFAGALAVVLFGSYKILEPELFRQAEPYDPWNKQPFEAGKDLKDGPKEIIVNRPFELRPDVVMNGNVEVDPGAVSVDKVIKSMVDRFTPLHSYKIHESPWDIAASWVGPRQIHRENAPQLGAVLSAMARGNITLADFGVKGTQLKLTLSLDHKQKVVFKPAWYGRDDIITGTPYSGRDRHNAEIAAFHLGRILELRRTPLAIGRRVDIHRDIKPVATERLLNTFFEKDGQACFYGKCLYCRGPDDGVCATTAGIMEGTLVLWLPNNFKLKLHKHPWSRTYKEGVVARWMKEDDYCDKVQRIARFSKGPRLLDIIDTSIFDYLIGNADRHHYETFEGYDDSMLIILDNGKSFGNPDLDERTILAPLYQCCQIRASTWQRLLALQDGVLSQVLAGVLANDPIAPVLSQRHLDALDRRLVYILDVIQGCITRVGMGAIVM